MKRRSITALLALALSLSMVLTACKSDSGTADNSGNKAADSAKGEIQSSEAVFGAFESETLEGEAVTEDIFSQADLSMVNIWGTFCGPCIEEMPALGELGRQYADKGVQVIGLIGDVDKAGDETALEIVEKTKADYTHLIASPTLQLGILSKVRVFPTTIFVDKDGNQVGDVYSGARDQETWTEITEALLKEVQ